MKRPPAIDQAVETGLAPLRGRRAAKLLPGAHLTGPVPWVLAIMVMLSVVATAGALAMFNTVSSVRSNLDGGALVQIVDADAEQLAAKVRRAETLLRRDPAVASFARVPQSDIAALLEPWLGAGAGSEALPLPALIEVTLHEDADDQDYARIQAALEQRVSGGRIDAQAQWLAPVTTTLSTLGWMAAGLVVLLALVSCAAVWLAARNTLAANRDTVEIVHLLGGDDRQIARIFQRSVLLDAVAGSAAGLIAGIALIALLAGKFAALDSGMVASGSLSLADWLVIALVPLFAVAIAGYTARMTVLAYLRNTL